MSWIKLQYAALRHLSVRDLASWIFGSFAPLWTLVEPFHALLPAVAQTASDWWWVFPGVGAIVGLWRAWPRLSVKYKIAGTDAEIEIRVCDLFEQDGALVVSSNTTFDTAMDDGTISKRSTQGQYTTRFCDNLMDLDRQIKDSLEGQDFKDRNPKEKPYGKQDEYPIGTVASVCCKGKSAYFVAVASLDKNQAASSTLNNILDALPRLWEFVQTRGDLERIAMPIMGSGLSRVQVERERLIREIVKSFIAAARTGRFCEYLTIAISLQDFSKANISLPKLGRFLEHECTYVSDSRPRGVPAHAGIDHCV